MIKRADVVGHGSGDDEDAEEGRRRKTRRRTPVLVVVGGLVMGVAVAVFITTAKTTHKHLKATNPIVKT